MSRPRKPLLDRIHAGHVVDAAKGCWLWQVKLDRDGYPRMDVPVEVGVYRNMAAHRVAYELFVGPIPDGLEIDHTCRVRSCVNPDHLEPVTHSENLLRSWAARRLEATA